MRGYLICRDDELLPVLLFPLFPLNSKITKKLLLFGRHLACTVDPLNNRQEIYLC